MPIRPKGLPRDPYQRAKAIVDIATGQAPAGAMKDESKRAGGKKRAATLTAKQRAEIASAAAQARWKKREN
jgi:hypothetical protein